MLANVHPHKTRINSGVEACVSVTPAHAGGRAYYKGAVVLRDVRFRIHQSGVTRARNEQRRNVHAWAVGEVTAEFDHRQAPPADLANALVRVTYHYTSAHFVEVLPVGFVGPPRSLNGHTFPVAYFCGPSFFVQLTEPNEMAPALVA
jgi:hypothetical protein